MVVRDLGVKEQTVVRWFAAHLDERRRSAILSDLAKATLEQDDDYPWRFYFHLAGCERPLTLGQRPVDVDAEVLDADGFPLVVVLFLDTRERLYGFEVIRHDASDVQAPDWTTLRRLGPGEVLDLGLTPFA